MNTQNWIRTNIGEFPVITRLPQQNTHRDCFKPSTAKFINPVVTQATILNPERQQQRPDISEDNLVLAHYDSDIHSCNHTVAELSLPTIFTTKPHHKTNPGPPWLTAAFCGGLPGYTNAIWPYGGPTHTQIDWEMPACWMPFFWWRPTTFLQDKGYTPDQQVSL